MAEIWGAAIAVAGAVGGAAMQADAAGDASRAQRRGTNAAIAEERRQFDLMRADTAPYREIGAQALGTLGRLYGYRSGGPAIGSSAPGGAGASSGWRPTPEGGMKPGIGFGNSFAPIERLPGTPGASSGEATGANYTDFFASPDYLFRRAEGNRGIERTFAARGMGKSGNALAALADYNSDLAAGEFGNWFNRQATLAGVGQSAVNTSTAAGANSTANIGNALIGGANARASGIADSANAWGNALGTIAGVAYDRWGRPKSKP